MSINKLGKHWGGWRHQQTHTHVASGMGFKLTADKNYDMSNKRLCHLADAIDEDDAVTLSVTNLLIDKKIENLQKPLMIVEQKVYELLELKKSLEDVERKIQDLLLLQESVTQMKEDMLLLNSSFKTIEQNNTDILTLKSSMITVQEEIEKMRILKSSVKVLTDNLRNKSASLSEFQKDFSSLQTTVNTLNSEQSSLKQKLYTTSNRLQEFITHLTKTRTPLELKTFAE